VSGAGPSILVLASDPGQRLVAANLVAERSETPWQALMLAVDFKGATVTRRADNAENDTALAAVNA
jgi:homoserine kinase